MRITDVREVRRRAHKLFEKTSAIGVGGFTFEAHLLPKAVDYVHQVITQNYPDYHIPFHSRWRHCYIGGENQWDCQGLSSAIDFVFISVLLDAGAGQDWYYHDMKTNTLLKRSEGLAIATLRAFEKGFFSADKHNPYRCDGTKLSQLSWDDFLAIFQNVLPHGAEMRLELLKTFGACLNGQRVSDVILSEYNKTKIVFLPDLLHDIITLLAPLWPTPYQGLYGDIAYHEALEDETIAPNIMPFYKLLQWLTYSCIEPLEAYGFSIEGLEHMTGLPEYRNGGLFVDLGVLKPQFDVTIPRDLADPYIVEWRAATIVLLDKLATLLREKLGVDAESWPLVKILEGGTWHAGRNIAHELRGETAPPPLSLRLSGTVF